VYFKSAADDGGPLHKFQYAQRLEKRSGSEAVPSEVRSYFKLAADEGDSSMKAAYVN
jgi:hypothetical protein